MTNNIIDFLKDNDVIFATWGVLGGLFLFLLDFYSNALYQREQWNLTMQQGNYIISETIINKNNLDIAFYPFLIGSVFFIFYFLSIIILFILSNEVNRIENLQNIGRRERLLQTLSYHLFEFFLGIFVILMFIYMAITFTTQLGIIALGILIIIGIIALIIWYIYRNVISQPQPPEFHLNP